MNQSAKQYFLNKSIGEVVVLDIHKLFKDKKSVILREYEEGPNAEWWTEARLLLDVTFFSIILFRFTMAGGSEFRAPSHQTDEEIQHANTRLFSFTGN